MDIELQQSNLKQSKSKKVKGVSKQIISLNSLQQNPQLSQTFFTKMYNLQHAYHHQKSQKILHQLIVFYTDCVTYFQINSSSAAIYFQNKIKQLAQQHNQWYNSDSRKKGRVTISRNIMKTMEQQNIYNRIGQQIKRAQNNQNTINNILQQQQQALEKRMRKAKRLTKVMSSGSFSHSTVGQAFSPQKKTARKPIKQGYLYFTTQIHSQGDQDNQ